MTFPKPVGKISRLPGHQLLPLPSIHGKVQAALVPESLQANAWLLCGLTMASADSFVLGPGMEENSFPKKHFKKMWKISTTQVSAQSGGGKSSRRGLQRKIPLAKSQGRNVKPYQPRRRNACVPFTFCPLLPGARNLIEPGSLSFLTGRVQHVGTCWSSIWNTHLSPCGCWGCLSLPVLIYSVNCPSLPTLSLCTVLHTLSFDTSSE